MRPAILPAQTQPRTRIGAAAARLASGRARAVFHPTHCLLLALTCLLTAGTTQAAQFYEGTAYARAGGPALYAEAHYLYAADGAPRQLVLYRCPAGAAFARKLLLDSPASVAPDFDFVDARNGYREGVRVENGQRIVYVQKNAQAARVAKPLPAQADMVIDAGFDTYVKTHWDALSSGVAHIPFLLPSRFGFIGIKLGGSANAREDGQDLRTLQMRLDAWYGFVAAPIELTYVSAERRLRRFEGIGTIRTDDGRNQDVRIEFPETHDREIPQSEVEAALAEPLSGRCAG
jgi:hypothetical protein